MAASPATGRLISSVSPYPSVHDTPTPPTVKLTSHPTTGALAGGGEPSISSSSPDFQLPLTPGRIAQFGSDLVWKTILSSVVEVQDIGPVAVSRLLHEVWKRGGGDAVTQLSLWSNIFMSLAFQGAKGVTRISAPSPDAALNLKDLYALTVRHWEPAIFAGLLSQHVGDTSSPFTAQLNKDSYGPATPTKAFDETDVQQWMNLTPGGLDIAAFLGTTPKGSIFPEAPFTDYFPPNEPTKSLTVVSDPSQNEVINDLITAIEDREEAAISNELVDWNEPVKEKTKDLALYQLPTPETDRLDSPSLPETAPHSSQTLPSTRQNSTSTQVLSPETVPPTPTSSRSHPHPSVGWKLSMPIEKFVPPPPMCMFFNPSFKDLQKGKVGLWQGDLVLRGKNGGKFGILIIGEAEASDLWQVNTWPQTIVYPPEQAGPVDNSTSSMIPVAHLAREGYTPAGQGMVLCKDQDVAPFVRMVQGLHAEGVAFHLPSISSAPVVFLPAKFDSSDVLQRLGVAFMTKPTRSDRRGTAPAAVHFPVDGRPSTAELDSGSDTPKKKRRRQSAPAKPSAAASSRRKSSLLPGGTSKIDEDSASDVR
ncbi:hypothetical protein M231_05674 [Tremella mesenterica]|uniref:ARID domain-containing protein n=1 Tax=Tremella mesenterica TaxID=5217 RepID=A0A4Q1BHJ7_TREME|nr:hypothetical protein M231_05674 [Tremella mesenterica]